jgi:misacylated tRNA(Ala) deacylase
MTEALFRNDAYLRDAQATVLALTEQGGIVLDRTVFYPIGGGQPGDVGVLRWSDAETKITTTIKGEDGAVILVPAEGSALPDVGDVVEHALDWETRYRHMRIHSALHLLSVVIPLPVSGGAITAQKGRLDFDMPEAPADKQALEDALNALIARNLPVTEDWITDEELQSNPGLVKTMSVMPPMGQGRVRLVRIGQGEDQVDLQPCGGTHVAQTGEIGRVALGKIEKKGRQNRRVNLLLVD